MPLKFKMKRDPYAGLLKPGVYRFVVEEAKESPNKNEDGNGRITLTLAIQTPTKKYKVWEGLSEGDTSRWRVEQFFRCVNAPDTDDEAGVQWFRGKSGWALFEIKPDNNGQMRSKVKTFLTEEEAEGAVRKNELDRETGETAEAGVRRSSRPVSRQSEDEDFERPRKVKKPQPTPAPVEELQEDDVPF